MLLKLQILGQGRPWDVAAMLGSEWLMNDEG
jgi:hypothetical protein